jgi:hypothetical protein
MQKFPSLSSTLVVPVWLRQLTLLFLFLSRAPGGTRLAQLGRGGLATRPEAVQAVREGRMCEQRKVRGVGWLPPAAATGSSSFFLLFGRSVPDLAVLEI